MTISKLFVNYCSNYAFIKYYFSIILVHNCELCKLGTMEFWNEMEFWLKIMRALRFHGRFYGINFPIIRIPCTTETCFFEKLLISNSEVRDSPRVICDSQKWGNLPGLFVIVRSEGFSQGYLWSSEVRDSPRVMRVLAKKIGHDCFSRFCRL